VNPTHYLLRNGVPNALQHLNLIQIRIGSRFNWVSGSGLGIRIRIQAGQICLQRYEKISKFYVLTQKNSNNFFCIKNLGLDPDTNWILIQQQTGSGFKFNQIHVSGSETEPGYQ
jgi:hypothetical protein